MQQKFRKRSFIIEAIQWTGENTKEVMEFAPTLITWRGLLTLRTLEGFVYAHPGDWIIKGIKGEFYPCKPDIFDLSYEVVE